MKNLIDIDLTELSATQQRQALRTLAKRANQRLVRLEKAGQTQWAYRQAMQYLKENNAKRFAETSAKIRKLSDFEVKRELMNVSDFLRKKTSTIKGIRQVESEAVERLRKKRYDVDNADFFEFLKSDEYKAAVKRLGSTQVMDNLDEALYNGISIDIIVKDYQAYLRGRATFQNVEQALGTGFYMDKQKRKKYNVFRGNV